jgi:hypothetical protein
MLYNWPEAEAKTHMKTIPKAKVLATRACEVLEREAVPEKIAFEQQE